MFTDHFAFYASHYLYEAVDAGGGRSTGSLKVMDQGEALRRIKEMGLFPTKVRLAPTAPAPPRSISIRRTRQLQWFKQGRVKPAISERGLDCLKGQVVYFFVGRSSCEKASGSLALGQSGAFSPTNGEAFGWPWRPSWLKKYWPWS